MSYQEHSACFWRYAVNLTIPTGACDRDERNDRGARRAEAGLDWFGRFARFAQAVQLCTAKNVGDVGSSRHQDLAIVQQRRCVICLPGRVQGASDAPGTFFRVVHLRTTQNAVAVASLHHEDLSIFQQRLITQPHLDPLILSSLQIADSWFLDIQLQGVCVDGGENALVSVQKQKESVGTALGT
jgi:hypothetical protein